MSKADTKRGNGHCAKGQCCLTGKGALSHYGNGGGKGKGVNVGKRSAGCVVKAHKKNPPEQQRNGSAKTGQGDRNHGTSPKHRVNCDSAVKPPVVKPPLVKPPVGKPPVGKPPVGKPPVGKPPVVKPSVVKPPVVVVPGRTPVGGTPVVARTVVRTPVAGSPVVASAVRTPVVGSPPEAASNPLPLSSAAGRADTSGQLAAGGFAAFAALLALGAGFVLRRRRGDV